MPLEKKPVLVRVRRIIEKARAGEEKRALDLFDLPTFKLSPKGTILLANEKAAEALGQKAQDFVGKHISDVIEEDKDPGKLVSAALEKVKTLEEGKVDSLEPQLVWRKHPSGQRVESIARFSFYKPHGGQPRIYASVEHTARAVEKSRILKDLFDLADTINAPADLDVVLQNIADSFSKKFNAACIVAKPNGGNTLKLAAFAGRDILPADFLKFHDIPLGAGLIGKAAESKKLEESEDIQKLGESHEPEIDKKYDFRHSLAIPLTVKGSNGESILVGVIGLFKHGPFAAQKFEPWEKNALNMLSENTATVIRNAQLTEALKKQAERVSLTNLYNRGYLFNSIRNYLSPPEQGKGFAPSAEGKNFGIIYADANNLKLVNDTQGYETGDRGLKTIAKTLSAEAPKKAVVSQIGGDEFAVFIPDAKPEETTALAQKLAVALKEKVKKDESLSKAGFGATFGHVHYEPGAQNTKTTRDLSQIHEKFSADEHKYLSTILGIPSDQMLAIKAERKRATGYIPRAVLENILEKVAQHAATGKIPRDVEKLLAKTAFPHLDRQAIKNYARVKRAFKEKKPPAPNP
ncbi:MAG: diguanylate cyclase [Candidatus Micrarchaeota archaeon]|nr:diguanylate cyclase [Candidatus Micrarchaeota archaeon]